MPDTKDWPQLLLQYGPYALLLLLIAVVVPMASSQRNKQPKDPMANRIYGATWTSIFVTCVIVIAVWIYTNVAPHQTEISGKLQGLPSAEVDLVTSRNLFLKMDYVDNATNTYDMAFVAPSTETSLSIALNYKGNPEGSFYAVATSSAFADAKHPVVLTYHRSDKTFSLDSPAPSKILKPQDSPGMTADSLEIRPPGGLFDRLLNVVTAYAQSKKPVINFATVDRLDAADPYTRADAEKDLTDAGGSSAALIGSILSDPGSSQRQLLGALHALNNSPTLSGAMFGLAVHGTSSPLNPGQCAIAQLADGPDGPVKTEAANYLAKHAGARKEASCQPIANRNFACKGARTVRLVKNNGIQRITAAGQHAYVMQANLTTANISTVYVIASEAEWPLDSVPGGASNPLFQKLKEVKDTQLQKDSYYTTQAVNGRTLSFKMPNGQEITIFVRETKFTSDRTDFQLCVG